MLRQKNSREIVLHTESQFYLPGDEIVGTVTYHPKKQVSLRFVKIIFAGEEWCIWIDKVAARVGGPVAASRAPLFRKETTLLSDRTRVEAGPHTWQFRFYIPRAIPPTCNYSGKTSVSYWLKTKAATTFGHFNARFRLPVIIGQFWIPSIPAPVQITQQTIGGSISMTVKSSHSVAKCDDIITLSIQFHNTSYRNLTGVRVKLKQVWECTGVFYHKNVVLKYFSKEGFPTSRGPHSTVLQLKIPHRLYTCPTVTNASLFKCTYYLGVYGLAKMAGLMATESVKCRVPITISNLPTSEHEGESSIGVPRPNILHEYTESSSDEEEDDAVQRAYSQHTYARDTHARSAHDVHAGDGFSLSDYLPAYGTQRDRDSQGNYSVRTFNDGDFSHDQGLSSVFNLDINDSEPERSRGETREKYNTTTTSTAKESKADSPDSQEKSAVGGECIVCYDGQKNMLMLPCAHIATCVSCTSYIMYSSKLCPVCRTKVSQVMRIYPV